MRKKKIAQKLYKLYEKDLFSKLFSRIRFWDAPFEVAEKYIPKEGVIVDLGCGDGLFSNYLYLSSDKRKIIGVDNNTKRISVAKKTSPGPKYIRGDVLNFKMPKTDCVVMFHLLHHLKSFKEQKNTIIKSMDSLKRNGKLVIMEIDVKFSLKYLVTLITDRFIYPIIFENKLYEKDVYFRNKSKWKSLLNGLGLDVKTMIAEKGKPFTHVIFVCKKPA